MSRRYSLFTTETPDRSNQSTLQPMLAGFSVLLLSCVVVAQDTKHPAATSSSAEHAAKQEICTTPGDANKTLPSTSLGPSDGQSQTREESGTETQDAKPSDESSLKLEAEAAPEESSEQSSVHVAEEPSGDRIEFKSSKPAAEAQQCKPNSSLRSGKKLPSPGN